VADILCSVDSKQTGKSKRCAAKNLSDYRGSLSSWPDSIIPSTPTFMVRKAVPQETHVEVLAACRRRCAICFGLNRHTGIKPGQIAHLDRNAANPSLDNLVFLCLEQHDQFDSRTSQSKGLTSDEVQRFRQELATAIEHAWRQPINFGSVEAPTSRPGVRTLDARVTTSTPPGSK
jgi:hypothetical protein